MSEKDETTIKQKKTVGSGINDGTLVIIKPKAYWKMRMHVLRFGSNAKDRNEYKEVMGMLMGRTVKGKNPNIDDVIVEDAVPISHGGKVEVAFEPMDYVNFSAVDAKYADKGLFNVGWYHSHPGLSCFFSAVDIRNQLGFQSANPAAIGIVFDHERFKDPDDLGFSVFRLDDPGKGAMSNYHEVDWIVEAPEEAGESFYTEAIKGLIDSYHKMEPPIMELSETPDVFGDTSLPGRTAMMAKEPEIDYMKISENLKKGVEELTDVLFQPFINYLNEWGSGLTREVIDKNISILEKLTDIKKKLSKYLGELQSWFKYQINDRLRTIDILIDDQLENQLKQQESLLEKMKKLDTDIKSKLASAFENALNKMIERYIQEFDGIINSLKKAADQTDQVYGKAQEQSDKIKQGIDVFREKNASLVKSTENLLNNVEMTINTNLGTVDKEIEQIVEMQRDFIDSIKALRNIINQL